MNDLIERSMVFDVIDKSETVDETYWRVRSLPPVPAIPISVIEGIRAKIGSEINVTRDQYSIRQNDYCDGFVFAMKQVLEIIDKHIKEYEE